MSYRSDEQYPAQSHFNDTAPIPILNSRNHAVVYFCVRDDNLGPENAMTHPDHRAYIGFTKRQRIDKAVHTLEGLLKGIAMDGRLSGTECRELTNWCDDQKELLAQHPFTELVPMVQAALVDGSINSEEQADLLWLCNNLSSGSIYYDVVTTDIQILHGILHGILADGVISVEEAHGLHDWLDSNSHLRGSYPYEELGGLMTAVLQDGKVDAREQALLRDFFEDFVSYSLSKRAANARAAADASKQQLRLPGVCAACPEMQFPDRVFCFTGASVRAVRRDIAREVTCRNGIFKDRVFPDLNYLVVGAAGNPCWAFSCYGRKVEEAVSLRRGGHKLLIVHENDFWDAVHDNPVPTVSQPDQL